jgi:NCS1 family nucleobase:cation symporter-1
MAVGMAVSIPLFSNQTKYVGYFPKHHGGFGDLTFEVGFVVSALVYAVLYSVERGRNKTVQLPA